MEDKKAHPLVKLMLARMESHPEEFAIIMTAGGGRWEMALHALETHAGAEEWGYVKSKMDAIALDEAHEWALDELLNGEERRAQEKDRLQRQAMAHQKLAAQSHGALQGVSSASSLGSYLNPTPPPDPTVILGQTKLSESMLKQIKGKLGL